VTDAFEVTADGPAVTSGMGAGEEVSLVRQVCEDASPFHANKHSILRRRR